MGIVYYLSTTLMRILLQNCKNFLYYAVDGSWTQHADHALDFKSSVRALEFCRDQRPPDVQIVLKFNDDTYDIDFPVSQGCKEASG